MKKVALFLSYAYSKVLRALFRPVFELIWLIGRSIEAGLFKARQSWVVDNFSTQSWLDFVESKLSGSVSKIKLDGKLLKFNNRGSQEFWRFKTLRLKEPDTLAWLSRMSSKFPTASLVDVGANVGIYSLVWLLNSSGKVLCFEPLPSNVLALQRNLEINNFQNRAQIFQVAAYNQMTMVRLSSPSMVRGEGFASIDSSANSEIGLFDLHVSTVRLDSLNLDPIPLIVKVDVEGAELEVTQGMIGLLESGQVKSVIFEKNPREDYVKEVLQGYGFFEQQGLPSYGNVVMDLREGDESQL
jgi:FkbM family methyltransferase